MSVTTTQYDEELICNFAQQFGAGYKYTSGLSAISPNIDRTVKPRDLDLTKGAIIGPAVINALYFDPDTEEPAHDVPEQLTETPERLSYHGHSGTPAATFTSPQGGGSTITSEYVDKAANLFGIADLRENLELVRIHPTDNYPVRIAHPDPDRDEFMLIAPRIRSDE